MKGQQSYLNFNRGLMSRLGLGRADIARSALSASVMTNWMPRVLGSMMLRPGLGYLGSTRNDAACKMIPFVFSPTDKAEIEATDGMLRFWVDDALVTRSAVTAAFTNGSFTSSITGWTVADEAGATSDWAIGGFLSLAGTGTNAAISYQLVTVVESGTEHSLRVVINRGPVVLRIGSTIGGAEFLSDASLGVGEHSITFTPTANFYVQFSNVSTTQARVDNVAFDAGGVLELTAPWAEASLRNIRQCQSGDVLFVACKDGQQYRIERRANNSWSCIKYQTRDGPFLNENVSALTMTASAITGLTTLTASKRYFRPTNVGSLFRLMSVGQSVSTSIGAANTFGNTIRITGVGEVRRFAILIGGTFTATVTLQYSLDEATWLDHSTYTTPTSTTLADGLDNQIVYYRLGIKTGNYTSGTADCTLSYSSGSITGVVRCTEYVSETVMNAEVLSDLGGTTETAVWAEGAWSDRRGWPSAVCIHDGRLFWAGKDKFRGGVTDQFETFDPDFVGDAGPISRSIGYGSVDVVNWLLSLNRMVAGTGSAIVECRSSSLDEPLTPTNFTPKSATTRGCADVNAAQIDNSAVFAQRSGFRLFELDNNTGVTNGALSVPTELTLLYPEACEPGIVGLAVQREPDTRIHCWLSDGTVAVLIFDRAENVVCWIKVETDGEVEDVVVQPGTDEDAVYYVVKRTIEGVTRRYRERWALESECRGAAINKLADSFVYAAGASNVITGLDHLEGQTVVAWGGGQDLGEFVVDGGQITLHATTTYTHRCAGLPYEARFKSTKLAYSIPVRNSLTLKKKIDSVGLILLDTHPQGLEMGPSFDAMDPMPEIERGGPVDPDATWDEYDSEAIEFRGEWDTDARLCMRATAPRACTVLAAVLDMEANSK